ncbi:PLP-dependent transferase [Phlegmacium glaucopus]|nr:PLP-dependent transferase [Phlegmacium glaucopus]
MLLFCAISVLHWHDPFHFGHIHVCFPLFEPHSVHRSVKLCRSHHAVGLVSWRHRFCVSYKPGYTTRNPHATPIHTSHSQGMGNSHSGHSTTSGTRTHPYTRKRSAFFSRISLGCVAGGSSIHSSEPSFEISKLVLNEKFIHGDDIYHQKQSLVAYSPTLVNLDDNDEGEFQEFLGQYPEYRLTWILDTLRRTDYTRLERSGETYVDYMGGALYPESLIRVHTDFLNRSVLGNTHSVSNSSTLSLKCANEARAAVLSYFNASSDYTVVFTANASAALKLVAEAYPFTGGSSLVIGADSHNSVHGIREFATYRGARTCYVPSTSRGGFDIPTAKNVLLRNRPRSRELAPSLFVMTCQSNISNSKNPLSVAEYASALGYDTVLDAAALAPTSVLSLSDASVDAIAISFYKMFGFPTGVGALVVKKSFLSRLQRPWFAGGTVDVVQVPGSIVTRAKEPHEQFEDGTINYLTLPAITDGLRFLSAYLPFLPLRLSSLILYLTSSLSNLRHDVSGRPVVQILSRTPTRRLRYIGEQSDTGSVLALLFIDPSGDIISNSFIEYTASKQNISLRTGCMCNPGGAAAILGIEEQMKQLYPGVTLSDFEEKMGRELGVVRISLGLASNFQDVRRVIQFATSLSQESTRSELWNQWIEARGSVVGQAM